MTLLSYTDPRSAPMGFFSDSAPTPLTLPSVATPPVTSLDQALSLLREAERVIQSQEKRLRDLENLAQTDELTGLLNRRGFFAALHRELARTRRTERDEGLLILLDLDDFKHINDLYGHDVGDFYLQTVGSVLINETRSSDFAARLGGDEFAVLIPGMGMKAAGARLAALEKIVNGRVMHSRQHAIPLRASFGFAILGETETPESLLIAADKKLYTSKARRKMGMTG